MLMKTPQLEIRFATPLPRHVYPYTESPKLDNPHSHPLRT